MMLIGNWKAKWSMNCKMVIKSALFQRYMVDDEKQANPCNWLLSSAGLIIQFRGDNNVPEMYKYMMLLEEKP